MRRVTQLIAVVFGACLLSAANAAELVTKLDFEDGKIPSGGGWFFGSQKGGGLYVSTDTSLNRGGSLGSLVGTYPIPVGESYVWGSYDISALNTRDVYIDFWAKMPKAKQGLKFLKLFGQSVSGEYANTTIAATYSDLKNMGAIEEISFGDGTKISNDTQNILKLNGTNPELIGRSNGSAIVDTPQNAIWNNWGTDWHRFRVHIKFNSGETAETEVADGEFYLEIDGKIYVDAKKLLNRHYTDKPLSKIGFFNWAQAGTTAFEIWYDDIVISTGGFLSSPKPPTSPNYTN